MPTEFGWKETVVLWQDSFCIIKYFLKKVSYKFNFSVCKLCSEVVQNTSIFSYTCEQKYDFLQGFN